MYELIFHDFRINENIITKQQQNETVTSSINRHATPINRMILQYSLQYLILPIYTYQIIFFSTDNIYLNQNYQKNTPKWTHRCGKERNKKHIK